MLNTGIWKYWTWALKFYKSGFGLGVDLPPMNADLVIVCYNTGAGWVPFSLLLPHQIYFNDLKEVMEEHPGIKEFAVFPVKSENYLTIGGDKSWEKHFKKSPPHLEG